MASTPVSTHDHDAFHEFERAGWESNVDEYDAAFARLTRQSVDPLVDAARVNAGTRVLDVACGPGYVSAVAAKRGAQVTGVDFSAPMVERARRSYPDIAFHVGDAEALDFPDGSFDAVVMSFGMLHLSRPERAMSEAARVLRGGGRFAFTVWAKPDEAVAFGIVLRAIQAHGNPQVAVPDGPPFFRFSEPAECERTLGEAGFADVGVRRVEQAWPFDSPDGPFEAIFKGGVRIRAILKAQTPTMLEAIRTAVRESTQPYRRNGRIELPMPSILASATKPG